jgi:ABC-type transporter Mla subunit MlaD
LDINVHHYFHNVPDSGSDVKYDQIIQKLNDLGANMSQLSDAVDAVLANEADEDARNEAALAAKDEIIAALQAQLEDLGTQLTTAMANDQADAQAIADARDEIERQRADMQEQIDRLNEAFPTVVTSTDQEVVVGDGNPPAEPPVENNGGSGPDDTSAPDSPPIDSHAGDTIPNPADVSNVVSPPNP